jgi:hypothetical protein
VFSVTCGIISLRGLRVQHDSLPNPKLKLAFIRQETWNAQRFAEFETNKPLCYLYSQACSSCYFPSLIRLSDTCIKAIIAILPNKLRLYKRSKHLFRGIGSYLDNVIQLHVLKGFISRFSNLIVRTHINNIILNSIRFRSESHLGR